MSRKYPRKYLKNTINIGRFEKGHISWNKKEKINKVCEICGKSFKVKNYRKLTARTCSRICQTKLIYRETRKYKKHSEATKKKISIKTILNTPRGKYNYNWKGGITPINEKIRKSVEYKLWRKSVFIKDNFTCQKTGQIGGKLVAHHINNFSDFPELRTSIENGITLSKESHIEFHKIYGKKNNTREQLNEFLNG